MPHVRTSSIRFLLAATVVTTFLPGRPAHAGIILAVGNPQNNGVMVFDGSLEAFAPASQSPAHANAGNGRSSLNTMGSVMRMSFEASGTALASTGVGNPIYFGAIPILIEGTSGEANGTPVTLQLQALGNVPPGAYTELFLNNDAYSANQTYTFKNFSVGSQFYLWAGVQADGHGDYTMVVTLSVAPALGLGSPVPEPSSLVLFSSGLLPIPIVWLKRKRAGAGQSL